MTTHEPKPCPFCGIIPWESVYKIYMAGGLVPHFFVNCYCTFRGPSRKTKHHAIQAWNRIRVEPVKKARKR